MDHMISAVMMTILGMNAIDAHWELSQHEAKKVEEAAAEAQGASPRYTWHGHSSLMDDLVSGAHGAGHDFQRLISSHAPTGRSASVSEDYALAEGLFDD